MKYIKKAPFFIGCQCSSLSINTAAALGAFSFAQVATATSDLLSDRSNFPHFYRTTPQDSNQAQGIIKLCEVFGWDSISILHDNDGYGTYLAVFTLELAIESGIDARAVGYQREDDSSILGAIESVASLGSFIIICIFHGSDLGRMVNKMEQEGIWGYPYFYIGVDAWLTTKDIADTNMTEMTNGYIGTVPWLNHFLCFCFLFFLKYNMHFVFVSVFCFAVLCKFRHLRCYFFVHFYSLLTFFLETM
jgi:ABC-type branched-subunit amino acid transport system substrate-binding protein